VGVVGGLFRANNMPMNVRPPRSRCRSLTHTHSQAEERLLEEGRRCDDVLLALTKPQLLAVVENALLIKHQSKVRARMGVEKEPQSDGFARCRFGRDPSTIRGDPHANPFHHLCPVVPSLTPQLLENETSGLTAAGARAESDKKEDLACVHRLFSRVPEQHCCGTHRARALPDAGRRHRARPRHRRRRGGGGGGGGEAGGAAAPKRKPEDPSDTAFVTVCAGAVCAGPKTPKPQNLSFDI